MKLRASSEFKRSQRLCAEINETDIAALWYESGIIVLHWEGHVYEAREIGVDIATPAVGVVVPTGEAESITHFMQRLANLCPRHTRAQLPRPTVAECVDCRKERNQQ